MSAERVAAINSEVESNGNHRDRSQDVFSSMSPVQLRIAQRPARSRLQRLLELADSLLRETDSLANDHAFTEESNRWQSLNISEGIDFYDEVKRFETGLIKLALDHTRGHQAQAARLLQIKPTTLNSKIKLYQIEY